jgi:hypothetical protein
MVRCRELTLLLSPALLVLALAAAPPAHGVATPLTFTRDAFVAASEPSPVDGFWLGTLG